MKKFGSFIFCLLFFCFTITTVLADGTYTNLGTSDAADGSNDAINFSQGRVWTIDKYGKYIWITQSRGGSHHWAWSNDNGANWTQGSESYGFLTRASVGYDSINDKLHVIWTATDSNDGIIYRRYGITRDGSNNITAISREDSSNINLQLDTSSSRTVEQSLALWVNDGSTNGSLIAIWSKNGSSLSEIRASMRQLSLSSADGTGSNWVSLDGTADTFSTDPPAVDADKIYGSTNGTAQASAIIRGGTGARKNDIYIFVAQNGTNSVLSYRGIWNSTDKNWSGGFQSPITVGSMNTTSGYSLKEQLITKPVLDSTHDRLYVGWARWKTDGSGDTVSLAYLDSNDSPSSTFDAYSANGTHSYAPSLDIAYDQTLEQMYISYIESTTNGSNGSIYYRTFNGTSFSSPTVFYTSPGGSSGADGSADIPILYENRSNNRLLFAFRINGSIPPSAGDPHTIDWGYITLPTPTSTPTPTATPLPTSTPIPNANSSNTSQPEQPKSTTETPQCTSSKPNTTPNLFQIDVTNNSAKIYFAPVTNANNYYVAFGLAPNDNTFGAQLDTGSYAGVLSYEIKSLSPSTTYFVRIRGGNGCMPGEWGNEMKFTTTSTSTKGTTFYKNLVSRITSIFKGSTTALTTSHTQSVTGTGGICTYTVESGDSLWSISSSKLGGGTLFQQLIDMNKDSYPNLNQNSILQIGWKFKYKC